MTDEGSPVSRMTHHPKTPVAPNPRHSLHPLASTQRRYSGHAAVIEPPFPMLGSLSAGRPLSLVG